MKPLVQSSSQRAAAVGAAALLLVVGFLPLFGGPGYEFSLAAGLVLPTCAAIATALDVARAEASAEPLDLVGRGAGSGFPWPHSASPSRSSMAFGSPPGAARWRRGSVIWEGERAATS